MQMNIDVRMCTTHDYIDHLHASINYSNIPQSVGDSKHQHVAYHMGYTTYIATITIYSSGET